MYPDIEAVFIDTGLEYPEIRELVKTIDNVKWLGSENNFTMLSKNIVIQLQEKQASFVNDLQNAKSNNEVTRNLRLTRYNKKEVFPMC